MAIWPRRLRSAGRAALVNGPSGHALQFKTEREACDFLSRCDAPG
jgi:hypothetical protein